MAAVTQRIYELQVKLAAQSQRDLEKLQKTAKKTGDSMSSLANAMKAVAGTYAISKTITAVIDATIESERAFKQLETVVESTGGVAGYTAEELRTMSSALQAVTTYGDETIQGAQALLLTFTKIGHDTFPAATEAVLNVATAMGTDLKSAALQVGKALNDPVLGMTALSRSGIQFTEEQKEVVKALAETGKVAQAQAIILAELETQFGNSARAARETFGGALKALQNAFGDLLEGDTSSGALTQSINDLTDALSDPQVKQAFSEITSAVLTLATTVANALPTFLGFTRWAAEELAAFSTGAAIGDIVRLEEELGKLQKRLSYVNPKDSVGIERLNAEIAAVQRKIDITNELAAADAIAAKERQNMEEDRKEAAEFDRQYFAEQGEREAARAKALVERKKLEEELAKIYAKERETAANKIQQMTKELELLQLGADALTTYAQLQVDISTGVIKLTEEERARLENLAELIDAEKAHNEELAIGETITAEYATAAEVLQQRFVVLNQALAAQTISQETYNRAVAGAADAYVVADEAARKANENLTIQEDILKNLESSMPQYVGQMSSAMVDFATSSGNVADNFADMAASILSDIAKMITQMLLMKAIKASLAGTGFGAFLGFAEGGAVENGKQVKPFAKGGVVTKPTIFPMANGTGLMGEAGPEAIMPLSRLANGKLGVESSGDSSGGSVTVNVINNSDATATAEKTTGPDGETIINVMVEKAVEKGIAAGRFDSTLSTTYGLTRKGR